MVNSIHIIEDDPHYRNIVMNDLSLMRSKKLFVKPHLNYESVKNVLKDVKNEDIFIIDSDLGKEEKLYDFFQSLQARIKYPKTIILSDNSESIKNKGLFYRNSFYDKVKFLEKNNNLDEFKKQLNKLLEIVSNERLSKNLILVKSDIQLINQNLAEYIFRNPKALYEISPRKFEELIADLFTYEGYDVELTPETNDGGKDIYAYKKDFFNENLFAVECKRYAPENKVGRPIVQKLYGVVESERLTGGILVTSSFYTKPAEEFTSEIKNRIFLKDHFDLMNLIKKHGRK